MSLQFQIQLICYFLQSVPLPAFLNIALGASAEHRFFVLKLAFLCNICNYQLRLSHGGVRCEFVVKCSLPAKPENRWTCFSSEVKGFSPFMLMGSGINSSCALSTGRNKSEVLEDISHCYTCYTSRCLILSFLCCFHASKWSTQRSLKNLVLCPEFLSVDLRVLYFLSGKPNSLLIFF